jgi:uncharacterized protein (DUF58 family)
VKSATQETRGTIHTDVSALIKLRYESRGFSFLPKQPINSLLSGRKRSRLRGRGLDFEELRHYRPGDDIRTMDWRVTNRTGKPHVRVYTEERDRPVFLIVDQRLSMFFGSQNKMKSVLAAELAALAAWRVLDQGDRVGGILFDDQQAKEYRASRSHAQLMAMLAMLAKMNSALSVQSKIPPAPQQFPAVMDIAERLASHDCLLVIISDFDGWDERALASVKRLSQHNDLIAALIYDPLEGDISGAGDLVVSDGRFQLQLEPEKDTLGQRFEAQFKSGIAQLQAELRRHGMPVLAINTLKPVIEQLREQLGPH